MRPAAGRDGEGPRIPLGPGDDERTGGEATGAGEGDGLAQAAANRITAKSTRWRLNMISPWCRKTCDGDAGWVPMRRRRPTWWMLFEDHRNASVTASNVTVEPSAARRASASPAASMIASEP